MCSFLCTLAILFFSVAQTTSAETLRIQILNGKTGKPVVNEGVSLFRAERYGDLAGNRSVAQFTTDANGIITTSEIAPDVHDFYVAVSWHRHCTKNDKVNNIAFSLQDVFTKGVVSENTCKPKLERSATPGTLILFVRDETFFEKMAH
jgi:5-hydroxyisourate hydrolase-like protein (transthyretin family)